MPSKKKDPKQLTGILEKYSSDAIFNAIREAGVNCPTFISSSECEGLRIAIAAGKIKKDIYISDYFNLDDLLAKSEAIAKFLLKFTDVEPCTGGCDPAGGKICRPVSLTFTATEGSAQMTLMKGTLYNLYC